MYQLISTELLMPFVGTALGSCCVLFMRGGLSERLSRVLTGFAAGVMTAASVWSLLLPSLEGASELGRLAFLPAVGGFWIGMLFLLGLDTVTPHLHIGCDDPEGLSCRLSRASLMILAVVLHNIPEGMAVGAALGSDGVSEAGAFALSLGIAVQNFPEGAIVAIPLCAEGMSRGRACVIGVLSGAIEPLAAVATASAAGAVAGFMPYVLAFAAGAMLYVVVEELIPEMSTGAHSNAATVTFAFGFTAMMALDGALS